MSFQTKLRKASYYPDLYGPHTPLQLIVFFERQLQYLASHTYLGERFRFHYGEPLTGRAWGDCDTGYVSMSTGTQPAPIVLHNCNSTGGPAILMNNIVKIEATLGNRVIYRHPRFHTHDEEPPEVVTSTENRALRRISLVRHGKRET